MNLTSTANDLVLYAYNELESTKAHLISRSLGQSPELADTVNGLRTMTQKLDSLQELGPSERCLENILAFAKNENEALTKV